DGECLAFFQFEDPEDQKEFGPELPLSGFRHLAMKVDQETQDGIRDRLAAAGYDAPDTYILNHGYCYSLYVFDPAKLLIEFTVDHEDVDKINSERKADAHSVLKRWLNGDHSPNNEAYHR
ncbi:MAG: VOC family protein, partial [Gammaproteobacteria bacterium]|nr:VOC family protein [Gammaproteobacteria bacterium]